MRTIRILTIALLATLLMRPSESRGGEVGEAGALFLRIGMGARPAAMGEAFTAVAKDASSVYWNPAAMAPVLGTDVMVMHVEYFESIRLEQAALTHETGWGTFGFGFTGLYMDDMDRYGTEISAFPLGQFSAFDVAFSGSYARYILPNLAAGVTARWIHEKIDLSTANGLAFDLGVYHVSMIEGVRLAAVLANVGAPMKYEDDFFTGKEFALPRSIKLGGSFERELPTIRGDALATFDIVLPNDGSAKQHIGVEYGYEKMLYLRAGYKAGYDSQGGTFGFGVVYRKLRFDYAFLLVRNDLGDGHRFSLALRL